MFVWVGYYNKNMKIALARPLSLLTLASISLLSSCFGGESNEVFSQGEINGMGAFASVKATLNASNKTVTITVGDYVSSPSLLDVPSTNTVTRQVKDAFQVTHTYEDKYSYFTVKLSSSDSQTICNAMGEMVQKPYPGETVSSLAICQEFRYYDGKLVSENPKSFTLVGFVTGKGYYNGYSLNPGQ